MCVVGHYKVMHDKFTEKSVTYRVTLEWLLRCMQLPHIFSSFIRYYLCTLFNCP